MNIELRHEEIESLLGAYALDAVSPEEAEAIERHLETCPRCRAEADAHREVASAIGNSFEPLPSGLWDRIAADLGDDPRRGDVVTPSPLTLPTSRGAAPAGTEESEDGGDELAGARRRRQSGRARRVAIAVASVAAVVIALLAFSLSNANNKVSQLRDAMSGSGAGAAASAARGSAGHQVVDLTTSSGAQLASFVLTRDGHGYLLHSSMPDLPKAETYQLWAMIGGQPISLGLMGDSPAQASFTVSGSATVSALAVTVEPAGGVVAPDRPPVATGKVVAA